MSITVNGSHSDIALRPEMTHFSQLRAEAEPWLSSCYLAPSEFWTIASGRSALIFGDSGSGKTAMRLVLDSVWNQDDLTQPWLVVEWSIHALMSDETHAIGSPLAMRQQMQIYGAIADAALSRLAQHPDLWTEAPEWVRITLSWFIHRYLPGSLAAQIAFLLETGVATEPSVMQGLLERGHHILLAPGAPPILVVGKLIDTLKRIGIQGVRVVLDNVEPWWETEPENVSELLTTFLSTLSLFEHPDFIYTMFLPAGLFAKLNRSSAVVRRRVQIFRLQYSDKDLLGIVERRLALAVSNVDFTLADLGPAKTLHTWLAGCGGTSPRGWLEAVRPFLSAYLGRSPASSQPLSLEECRRVQQLHPPGLWIDPNTQIVTVGWRPVSGLGPGHLAVLQYLFDRPARLCTRKQLYLVYVEAYPESQGDPDAKPSEYAGVLDSALWRLRALIEPDPTYPVLLETRKGQGVILRGA